MIVIPWVQYRDEKTALLDEEFLNSAGDLAVKIDGGLRLVRQKLVRGFRAYGNAAHADENDERESQG